MPAPLDVAIVGGGPGGLAAAISLQRALPGIRLEVYERSPNLAPRGAGLRLESNGLKALQAIEPAALAGVQAAAVTARTSVMMDAAGRVLRSSELPSPEDVASAARYGMRPVLIGWWELVEALRAHVPAEVLRPGSAVQRAVERPGGDGVDLYPEGSGLPVHARLLVGCDGHHSAVWRDNLAGAAPDFADVLIWRARLPAAALPAPCDHIQWIMGGGVVGLVFPVSNGDAVWTVSAQAERLQAAGLGGLLAAHRARSAKSDGSQRLAHCLAAAKGYPAGLLALIAATDPDTILEHGAWVRDPAAMPEAALGCGCVTVLGDAFHPLRPTGQGTNVTLEDAAVLGASVARHGLGPEALRAYEAARLPRVKAIMQQTMMAGQRAYGKGATLQRLFDGPAGFASQEEWSDYLYATQWQDVASAARARVAA